MPAPLKRLKKPSKTLLLVFFTFCVWFWLHSKIPHLQVWLFPIDQEFAKNITHDVYMHIMNSRAWVRLFIYFISAPYFLWVIWEIVLFLESVQDTLHYIKKGLTFYDQNTNIDSTGKFTLYK